MDSFYNMTKEEKRKMEAILVRYFDIFAPTSHMVTRMHADLIEG